MKDDYMSSTIEISINEFGEKYIDGKTVTFYKIEIYDNYSKESWFLEKRYSELDLLHKTLSKLYPNIPPMPGKTLFKIKDRDQLEKRKKQLETPILPIMHPLYYMKIMNYHKVLEIFISLKKLLLCILYVVI